MPPLARSATVAEIVSQLEATVRVFQRHDIDFSCRGDATVLEACRERDLDPEEVYAQLEDAIAAAAGGATGDDPRGLPDDALVARIVERHHAHARRALPYIVPLLAKVASFHGRRNRKLDALCDAGHELADTIERHLDEEERELFPAIVGRGPGARIPRRELDRMYREHRDLGALLLQIRSLADGYVAPEWGGGSYRVLLEELEALEDDVRRSMHLENHVLLPRLSSPAGDVR